MPTTKRNEQTVATISLSSYSKHQPYRTSYKASQNVFLLWPNVIGYIRIILTITSLYFMALHPFRCSALYSLSCLLDALDGFVARYLDQSSRFGAVLDMVTDRCTTACLLVFLSSAWPRWAIFFQGLISLDFASHYMHMYASLSTKASQNHKIVDKEESWLLNLYYSNKIVLSLLCAFNELFFIALYLLVFTSTLGNHQQVETTAVVMKNPQRPGSFEIVRASKIDSTWPIRLACISFLGMFLKQFINILQLVKASIRLANGDSERRLLASKEKLV